MAFSGGEAESRGVAGTGGVSLAGGIAAFGGVVSGVWFRIGGGPPLPHS